jgi:hypothetical protein
MFNSLHSSVFDDPGFKEDAVREEVIAPLLRRLGYLPTGSIRVERSKSLVHPFVHIGMGKHNVRIIPDYTLYSDSQAILVIDAKGPSEAIVKSAHVEQAYSYAIHPEVQCRHFALCNGRQLILYSVDKLEPVFLVPFERLESDWNEIERHLSARYLLTPALRLFQRDLGIFLHRLGMAPDSTFTFLGCRLQIISRMGDDCWTATASIVLDGEEYMGSFDFPTKVIDPMFSCLASPLAEALKRALSRPPFHATVDLMIEVDWTAKLGTLVTTEGEPAESLIPLSVIVFSGTRLNRDPVELPDDVPRHVFSLRRKFDELQAK